MSDIRRGVVIILQHGDPEISGAIADGILAARAATEGTSSVWPAASHLPQRGRLLEAEPAATHTTVVEVVTERGGDHVRTMVRQAVGNTRTAEDYRHLIAKARGDYAQPEEQAGPLRRLGRDLVGAYALLCYGVAQAYRRQARALRRRRP